MCYPFMYTYSYQDGTYALLFFGSVHRHDDDTILEKDLHVYNDFLCAT